MNPWARYVPRGDSKLRPAWSLHETRQQSITERRRRVPIRHQQANLQEWKMQLILLVHQTPMDIIIYHVLPKSGPSDAVPDHAPVLSRGSSHNPLCCSL
jgi:hypothetical protein